MKKIIFILTLALVLVGTYLGFQGFQARKRLAALASGKTYSNFGMRLQIPPGNATVQGWLRPSLEVSRAVLDLTEWDKELSIDLTGGRLQASAWSGQKLRLSFAQPVSLKSQAKAEGLVFELVDPEQIRRVFAKSIDFETPKNGEPVQLLQCELFLGAWVGWLPDRLALTIDSIQYRNNPKDPVWNLKTKKIEVALVSEVRGKERSWKIYGGFQGSSFQEASEQTEIAPMEFKWTGTSQDMPREEVQRNYADVAGLLPAIFRSSPPDPAVLRPILEKTRQLTLRLQPEFNSLDFFWEGMKTTDGKSQESFVVHPAKGVWQMKFQQSEGLAKGKLEWQGAKSDIDGKHFELTGMEASQSAEYHGLSYQDLLVSIFDYYDTILLVEKSDIFKYLEKSLGSIFAQYPNATNIELKFGKMSWEDSEVNWEGRDATLGFKIAPERWEYLLKGGFDYRHLKDSKNDIQGAKFDLNFGFKFPWEKMISLLRLSKAETQPLQLIARIFEGQLSGVDWKWKIDLGPSLFTLNLDLNSETDVGKLLAAYDTMNLHAKNIDAKNLDSKKLEDDLIRLVMEKGRARLKIGIERFSKFQASLDKIQPGASLALAVLAPYIIIDGKADTLNTEIEIDRGKLTVNSKPDASLEKILMPK